MPCTACSSASPAPVAYLRVLALTIVCVQVYFRMMDQLSPGQLQASLKEWNQRLQLQGSEVAAANNATTTTTPSLRRPAASDPKSGGDDDDDEEEELRAYHQLCPSGIRFKDPDMRLCRWAGLKNFGDELGFSVVDKILESHFKSPNTTCTRRIDITDRNQKNSDLTCFATVGSIIHFLLPGDYAWSSGTKVPDPELAPNVTYYSVRGPKTMAVLKERNILVPPPNFGDGGFAVPYLFPEYQLKRQNASAASSSSPPRRCFIRHYRDNKLDVKGAMPISVAQPWQKVFQQLSTQCDYLASSSLHGIISGDALGLPTMWYQKKGSGTDKKEGSFKYQDYMLSIGRENPEPEGDMEATLDFSKYQKPLSPELRQQIVYRTLASFPYHLFEKV